MGDDPIVGIMARLHNLARTHGICYVVAYSYRGGDGDDVHCSFHVKSNGCSDLFASVVWYWVQMNFKPHEEWEREILPYAAAAAAAAQQRRHQYCQNEEARERAKTLLECIWKEYDLMKHGFLVVYAELSEHETILLEDCPEEHTPSPVINAIKLIVNR